MIRTGESETAVTIESVEEDPQSVGGDVFLHRFIAKDENGNTKNVCAPDPQGRSVGFPVPDGKGGFELTCTSGAIGKCVRWGYRFWEEKPGGPPLRALHKTCIHMTRADYGGDGSTFTRDGTMIDFCDRFGIQTCEWDRPISFEAAWGVDGAVCVARPRIPGLVSIEGLAERYPRLRAMLGPDGCTRESAERDPAVLLFNRS